MKSIIHEIASPVQQELILFEQQFKEAVKSETMLLNKVTSYMLKRKGKQIRPLLVLLTAKLCGGVTASTYNAASLIELLHTATLVHDDVVDDSSERRGFFSINALWKNKISVLVGDFLLSKGLLLSLEKEEYKLLQIVSNAVKEMSEGELLQIEKARRLNITEEVYFEIIRKKTASLFAACCGCGAYSSGMDEDKVEKMKKFGEYIGIAFQIKDDLLDYGQDNIGKPTGIDIREQKMTLPLIYTLNNVSIMQRRKIIRTIKKDHKNKPKVDEVISMVKSNGGMEYATAKMNDYIAKAEKILLGFPNNETRESLLRLVKYSIERKK